MKKLNELKNGKTKEEMDAEAIRIMNEIATSMTERRARLANDPMMIEIYKDLGIDPDNYEKYCNA